MPEDHEPKTASYVIFEKDGEILLHKRKNTGFKDGHYSLVAGHVDEGETFSEAMIREAKEEVGVEVKPEDLEPVHVLHRTTGDSAYVDLFFKATEWEGEITNEEPEKCSEIRWVEPDNLPEKTIDYIAEVIEKKESSEFYGEEK
ncbi:NUDIX hydrolase [Candidatus Nanohalococcus occultus]|uniref:NUDIX hydrolase n=1 Tax=Candidatus Nanohalococcus occultus TaxID=2978047 RepID=UPI0039E0BA58